jgi:hypothetical protein
VRATPREQDDRLEERRLAGSVRPDDQLRPGPEPSLEIGVRANAAEGELGEQAVVGRLIG